jgi:hypothetical protein
MFCLSAVRSYAQQQFSGEFRNLIFTEFAAEIEKKSDYRFFYDPQGIDTLKIDAAYVNKSIEAILDQLFLGTSYRYAVDANLYIYITNQTILLTELPAYFFTGGPSVDDTKGKQVDNTRFEEAEKVKIEKLPLRDDRPEVTRHPISGS